jgi:hypothetical protein
MRRLEIATILLVFACLIDRGAWAQGVNEQLKVAPGSTNITFFVGVSSSASAEDNRFALEADTGTPIGSRLAYNFNSHHAVEFSVATPFSVSGNYLYQFSPVFRRWLPYATAGIGGARRELGLGGQTSSQNSNLNESANDVNQTAFTGNFGGGVFYLFGHRLAARFDVRDQIGHYQATFGSVPGVPTGIVKADRTIHDVQITGGMVFRFGSR